MKKQLLAGMFTALLFSNFTDAQVGISTDNNFTPNTSSILEVSSTNKGVLLPRVALTATNVSAPITGTVPASLMIYNTATAGTGNTAVTPGFYYWSGGSNAKWIRVVSPQDEAHPIVFYAPSIALDTTEGTHSVDLHLEYTKQFGTPVLKANEDSPLKVYSASELAYFITYIDNRVFTSPTLTADGKLNYTVPANAPIDEKTFINAIFKVRK